MELAELQKRFSRSIAEAPGGEPGFALRPAGRLTPAGAMAVHRDGYYARLGEALDETFAGVAAAVGEEEFRGLCRAYVAGHPSGVYNLSDYGADFPAFLARDSGRWPFLQELADFEWDFSRLFHQRQHEPLSLVGASPGSRLGFAAASRLRRHERAVYGIWKRRAEGLSSGWDKPELLFLYKRKEDIVVHELEPGPFEALRRLRGGETIEDALDRAARVHPDFTPQAAAELFSLLAASGAAGLAGDQSQRRSS